MLNADMKMDEQATESSNVSSLQLGVSFYARSSHHAASQLKTVPGVQIKAVTHAGRGSHGVGVHRQRQNMAHQSESGDSRSKMSERRPKSIECARLTKSKYRLMQKPKYTLLPYKRGQLRFCTKSDDLVMRDSTPVELNCAEKENRIYSDSCHGSEVTEKTETLNMQGDIKRFFKASFSKRRQFTFNVPGLTAYHTKLNRLKQRERKTVLRNKPFCTSGTKGCSNTDCEQLTDVCSENDLHMAPNIDPTGESLYEDAAHKNCNVVVESVEAAGGHDTYQAVSSSISNEYNSSADVMQHSDIVSVPVSDTMDCASPSQVLSKSILFSDNTVSSCSAKHGTFQSLCAICSLYVISPLVFVETCFCS